MLNTNTFKKRLTACLILKNNVVVQSIKFSRYLPIGSLPVAVEFLNSWGVDEIIILDIDATKNKRRPNFGLIKQAAEKCYVPLAVGGGITSIEDITELMHCGADKIVINNIAIINPSFISVAAKIFGNQCVIVSMDVVENDEGGYSVFSYKDNKVININPVELAKRAEFLGAGELLINSVDRDGSKSGYDIGLIKLITNAVNIPVIAGGGAGKPIDFLNLFKKTNVSAASAGNYFNFFEHSVNITKAFLNKKNVNIRLDSSVNYLENKLIGNFRLAKKTDQVLENLLYEKINKEII